MVIEMDKKQKINCNVHSCEHCDCECNSCNLREIEISKQCGCPTCKEETICSNYEKKEK